ncbi:hypothetical protein Poli38472_005396 [Pythium oligandrum]|uniref:Major facilitator superfamily (MFS) profile domain-containing protein n=1 Tax=Pythium oligandrum TaxID=41045 RepID=A0A8K1CGW6_PYTOL|nr:hypothetical protein Poli38472_005396 [Pythium oligandrum]|eukprot:TMW62778.1 hypothetical protein Poli38472_005396 [Pythium oligandrum]
MDYGRRVLSLTAGIAGMIGVGSIYAISAWNAELKDLLHFSQAGISTVSSMALLGAYLSFFPGILFDRIGPFKSILLGGFGLAILHAVLYASLTYFPESVDAFAIGLCLLLVGQLSAFVIFSTMVANEGIFGVHNRGKIMATLTSAYSCGGAFFAFVFQHAFVGDVPGYFVFVGTFLVAVCLFGWGALYRSRQTRRLSEEIVDGNVGVPVLSEEKLSLVSNDVTGVELLRDTRFWLLFVPVLIIIGAGLFVMSNVSFIVESLGGPAEQVPLMVALFSVSNTLCRLATGTLSDLVLSRYPRATFAAASVLMTVLTQLGFLWIPSSLLIIPVTMAGMAEGVMFGSFPVIMREAFGVKHYGKNYGLISFANCIGYPLFYSPISSFFYQRAAISLQPDGMQKCYGDACFRPVFLLIIGLSVVALVCCLKLISRQFKHHPRYHVLP